MMEYYPTLRRREILTQPIIRMNLEDILLSAKRLRVHDPTHTRLLEQII